VDTTQIKIGGATYDFNLSMYAADLAQRLHGFNIFESLDKVQSMYVVNPVTKKITLPQDRMIELFSTYADIVWCGILPFDNEITREEIKIDLNLSDVKALSDIVAAQVMKLTQGHNKSEVVPETGKKKAPLKTSGRSKGG
jgi:hypothetical protein